MHDRLSDESSMQTSPSSSWRCPRLFFIPLLLAASFRNLCVLFCNMVVVLPAALTAEAKMRTSAGFTEDP